MASSPRPSATAPQMRPTYGVSAVECVHSRRVSPLRGACRRGRSQHQEAVGPPGGSTKVRVPRRWNLRQLSAPLGGHDDDSRDRRRDRRDGRGITAAEGGADVELRRGARPARRGAWSLAGEWGANWRPHALYADGPFWTWSAERDLLPPVSTAALTGLRFRSRVRPGARRRGAWRGPFGLLRARSVPDDISFREWAADRYGRGCGRAGRTRPGSRRSVTIRVRWPPRSSPSDSGVCSPYRRCVLPGGWLVVARRHAGGPARRAGAHRSADRWSPGRARDRCVGAAGGATAAR